RQGRQVTGPILVINAGSSSIKFELFDIGTGDGLERRLKGQIDGIGTRPRLAAKGVSGDVLVDERYEAKEVRTVPDAMTRVGGWLRDRLDGAAPAAVGHRVVHGGPRYSAPTRVDDAVLAELERFEALAPLHQPNNLAAIKTLRARAPELLQVACFDTAFH